MARRAAASTGALVAPALAIGCMDAPAGVELPIPRELVVVAGAAQDGVPGMALAQEVVVRLVGPGGGPLADFPVLFEVVAGGGSVEPARATTDAQGEARAAWTLGPEPAENRLVARVEGVDLPAVQLTARGTWGPGTAIDSVAAPTAGLVPGGCALGEVRVRVLDAEGDPAAGATVLFEATAGGGTVEPAVAETGADGIATALWRSGLEGGHNALSARLPRGDVEPLRFEGRAVPRAPGGFAALGNQIYGDDCEPHRFTGVARPSLQWSSGGDARFAHVEEDFRMMREWGANIVRIPLNQSYWVEGTSRYDPSYEPLVVQTVEQAIAAGLAVILDLHVSDRGDPDLEGVPDVQQMPDRRHSIPFWRDVAATFKDEGRVIFELYNEPHDIDWSTWRDGGWIDAGPKYPGGPFAEGYEAVGIQELYDTVRETGARNLVILSGTHWGYYLDGVPDHPIEGYNIAYSSHPYDWPEKQPVYWTRDWGFMAETAPVIITEFGARSCDRLEFTRAVLDYADAEGLSWVGWAWWTPPPVSDEWTAEERQAEICEFPALLENWDGTPSRVGEIIKERLASYARS